jgi:hypothetical protein
VKDPFHAENRRPAGGSFATSIAGRERSGVLLRGTDLAIAAFVAVCAEKIEARYAEGRFASHAMLRATEVLAPGVRVPLAMIGLFVWGFDSV